jgi:cytochrome c oxidase subunit 2
VAAVLERAGGHSTLVPVGPKSEFTTVAWWLLFAVAAFVCVAVIALVVGAAVFRRRARRVSDSDARGFVLTFGVVIPALVFAATFALSVVGIAKQAKPSHPAALTISVVGHEWWWEVRYPGGAVTANEIHVPVGQPVDVRLSSADVIHSFWVPEVMPKMDMIPGHTNDTWFTIDKAGTYRGQCAEYCGIEHAHMAFEVVAQPQRDFTRWLDGQQQDAATPTSDEAQRGYDVLITGTCATCHTVRGTSADGKVGPDLTHVASRSTIGALTVPNDRGNLAGWIANSQQLKPGNKMPPQPLSPADLNAVVAYLETLR